MKFGFVAKHRETWPVRWLCEALGVSCSRFHGWLTRPRSASAQSDEELTTIVRARFVASSRTYGARRIWCDVLADGGSCGLHHIERLMRSDALRARPRRRGLPADTGTLAAGGAIALINSFGGLGLFVGSCAVGWLNAASDNADLSFLTMAGTLLLSRILTLLVREVAADSVKTAAARGVIR